jgi:hypothetical protein
MRDTEDRKELTDRESERKWWNGNVAPGLMQEQAVNI